MAARHFSLDEVLLTWAQIPITEFADGESISIELNEDDWITSQGHHGSVLRAKKPNQVAVATITTMVGSPVNELLSAAANTDLVTGLGSGPFAMQDLNGTTNVVAPQAWVQKRPNIVGATEPGSVEWTVTLANPVWQIGQNRLA